MHWLVLLYHRARTSIRGERAEAKGYDISNHNLLVPGNRFRLDNKCTSKYKGKICMSQQQQQQR